MHLPTEGIGIGFLGRFVPEKGPLLFLEALRTKGLLQGTPGPVWAAVAGSGPLEVEVASSATSTGAHFLGALNYWTEVPTFFRCIDVFVAPSWKTDFWEDQSPRTVIEAMLSGCVVVGSDSGAIPSMIGEHGVVVEEKNVSALVAGLRRAMELSMTGIGGRARASAMKRYSGPEEAERLLSFWRACVDEQLSEVR
jgi:glycosyltransferase involved in cell wall biosynthesis